ncbi:hypothetical protein Tco_1199517 [Tanacetum coccineum]
MNMTLQSSIKDRILAAQKEACDESAGLPKGLDEMLEHRSDGALNGFSFKVNGQRLKKYYRSDNDKEDDDVIELENDATRS